MINAQETSSDYYLPTSWKDITERLGPENILVVDDDPYLGCVMGEMLTSLGYNVVSTISGSEALNLFIENPSSFDLVISDLNMSYMNGDELALKLMDIRKDIPIIICFESDEFTLKELMKWVPIRSYIQKPIEMRSLAATVRKVLDDGRNSEYMQDANLSLILERRRSRQFS